MKKLWYRTEYVFNRNGELIGHQAIVKEWGTGGAITYKETFKTEYEAQAALRARYKKDEADKKNESTH